ncbi:dihydroorotate dehydrogenase [Herbaspirillum sp. AP02]|uniref:dihydroorotate dehydrogenase n=1 Tax=unclassified Herbaspirillum TaxID=2624150 RepID=UPI0015DB3C28|nr:MULTISPECIES: dihydroorotate dehydrogenase [unclassified Herbaspirillum]MBG7619078.1 dihydroorotate dehydrogenase [Herbaspirillum sp. AP02]NZD66362.1 dihydroorotate dehydrogenase [Herbaspirillum sp. AP21]
MVDMSVSIGKLTLQNPVMPGSGTFAEGMAKVIDLNRLGAIVTKTITSDLREGNTPPRVAELRNSTLFSIGIPSKGPEHYLEELVPFYRNYTPPLVASISANTVEEFGELAARLSVPGVAAIEANISCPNLKKDGQAFGMDPQATEAVIKAMKRNTDLQVWAKLSPNVGSIAVIARAAEQGGADALVSSNAILAMAIDIESHQPKVANLMGGITGSATKPILLRMAYQAAQAVSIPVIGCGGIATAEDAIEYLLAGCTAVQVGTANFISTSAMPRVIDDLQAYCLRRGITRIRDLVGAMKVHEAKLLEARAGL